MVSAVQNAHEALNLAERAAETIGADPLLARVAAYYHDIGKMKNPLAFIENQAGARNVHDDLDPETRAGWAVMVVGYAQEITDPDEVRRMKGLPLRAWFTTDRDHFIRVSIELIDGRRLYQDMHDEAVTGDQPAVRPSHAV